MITGKGLSKEAILIKDTTTSALFSSRGEGMEEESTCDCTIRASTAHAWPQASPKAYVKCIEGG